MKPEPAIFTACWFAAIFIFFSGSQGKCLVYILPAVPPLAILTGIAIDAAATALLPPPASSSPSLRADPPTPNGDRVLASVFTIASQVTALSAIAIASLAAYAVLAGVPPWLWAYLHPTDRGFLEIFLALISRRSPSLIAGLIALVVGAMIAFIGVRRAGPIAQATGVCVIAAAGSFCWFAVMSPALAERQTLRAFARQVALIVPPGAEVGHLGLSDCDLNFYSAQPLTPIYRLRCGTGDSAPIYVVARKRDFDATAESNRKCYRSVLASSAVDNFGPRILLESFAARK